MKTIYYFDEKHEYDGSGFAQLDPLETEASGHEVYLLPASATFEVPPPKLEGHAIVWVDDTWRLVEDNRGVEYWLHGDSHHDSPRVMRELGELPCDATLTRPEKPLEEVKFAKIIELKNERTIREEAPVEYGGKLWDFDSKARDRITAAVTALEVGGLESLEWTAHDDTSARLSALDLKGIVAAAALRGDSLHKKYRELRDAANGAESAGEVNAVSWGD